MPAGSFDLSYGSFPIAGYAIQAGVFRYAGSGDSTPYSLLPNVRCLQIDNREGPEPPTARFQYVFDDAYGAYYGWPSQFEDVWPLDAQGYYVVRNDDRIVVADQNPDGSLRILFDGFAEVPQVDVAPRGQSVTFRAVNVAIRCFDIPITGRTQRDSSLTGLLDSTGASDIRTNLPTRFNPANHTVGNRGGFLPNCTPDNFDTQDDAIGGYPVFCDPLSPWAKPGQPSSTTYWTVGKAIRYLLARYNHDEDWVTNPDLLTIDKAVYDYSPAEGLEAMNPNNPATYTTDPVTIRDYNAANKPWPRVVSDLLGYAGFYMRWETFADEFGDPETALRIHRRDEFATSPLRWLYLDEDVAVDQTPTNTTGLKLARDSSAIVNAFSVETSQRQVEISIVLLPLFQPAQGDEAAPASSKYIKANWGPSTDATTRRKYRWFGADELGEGHLGIRPDGSTTWRTTACAFENVGGGNPIFPPDQDGNPTFVRRYRPGHNTLISTDSTGRPLRATLQIVMPKDADTYPYALDPGTVESVEDIAGSFNVYDVPNGWDLLPDRLGIEVTADDPQQWMTGARESDGTSLTLPQIEGLWWWANPGAVQDGRNFGRMPVLLLTVVIDDDLITDATANPRFVSPTRFARWRVIDGRDHFKYTSIDPSSRYYAKMGGNGQDPFVVRDDSPVARAHANQLRSKHEFPPTGGSVTLPYITDHYAIGDQLMRVSGRDVNLQTNVGASQGEQSVYPWVVGVSWGFENDRQSTTLIISDRRADVSNAW